MYVYELRGGANSCIVHTRWVFTKKCDVTRHTIAQHVNRLSWAQWFAVLYETADRYFIADDNSKWGIHLVYVHVDIIRARCVLKTLPIPCMWVWNVCTKICRFIYFFFPIRSVFSSRFFIVYCIHSRTNTCATKHIWYGLSISETKSHVACIKVRPYDMMWWVCAISIADRATVRWGLYEARMWRNTKRKRREERKKQQRQQHTQRQ